jgi:hypothetical protein
MCYTVTVVSRKVSKMAQINRPTAYRVDIVEHDRFMGSKIDETLYFDNEEEARKVCNDFNAGNTATTVPDWYMVAEYRGAVK